MQYELFQTFAISLGLGLLVGLQRQHDKSRTAGIRTFPLFTLFGTTSAYLAHAYGGWVIAAGLLSVASMIVVSNLRRDRGPEADVGQTTEAAAVLMFAVGAFLVLGHTAVAVAIGGTVAVLLHLKARLHRFVERIGKKDITAIMQFVVVSLVILPVLPDRNFGPYNVLNPYNIWLMVVLIVGIGLLGYFVYKILGTKAGTLLGGMLGGLISSTATTVSYARRTKNSSSSTLAAFVIFIASIVSVLRIITEVAVVSPGNFMQIWPPLIIFLLFMTVVGFAAYFFRGKEEEKLPEQGNPAQLKTALLFGTIYAAVTLATAAAKDYLGNSGMYIVAVISGLTDVDAITLSTSRLMNVGKITPESGWRIILVAALSNIAFKGVLAGVLGSRSLFGKIVLLFGISLVAGSLVLWLWTNEFLSFI